MAPDITSLITVFLLSASPIGEILIAIPVGVALGMEPLLAFTVAYPANLVPIVILLPLLAYLDTRFPRFFNYFARRGGRFQRGLQGKYGSVIMLLVTPIIGVYAASISSKFLRFGKKRSFVLQSVSVAMYGLAEAIGIYFGIKLLMGL
nr:small multi-drug export protein [Candidatus Njordarchaeota archaeon]